MSDDADLPEPDKIEGAPHPREAAKVFGHDAAQDTFLQAFAQDRVHHAWLLTGPKGIGKATLAWRIARFLLATPIAQDDGMFGAPPPPTTLDIDAGHPVARRLLALSDPGLFLLRRGPNDKGDKLAADIRVTEARKLKGFFALSATDGGRRVVLIDCADELNPNAANAILKLLEEPPARTTFLIVAHQPARLLPTIRSRCRALRLSGLAPEAMQAALAQADITIPEEHAAALAELSGGSVGAAATLWNGDGLTIYQSIAQVFAKPGRIDRPSMLQLAEACAGRNATARLDLTLDLVDKFTARTARAGALGAAPQIELFPGEARLLATLAPDPGQARLWAETAQSASQRARHGRAVNLEPALLVTDLFLSLAKVA